jgi:hypothetical protein
MSGRNCSGPVRYSESGVEPSARRCERDFSGPECIGVSFVTAVPSGAGRGSGYEQLAVSGRGDGGGSAEVQAQVGRGAEADLTGIVVDGQARGLQQLLGALDPLLVQPGQSGRCCSGSGGGSCVGTWRPAQPSGPRSPARRGGPASTAVRWRSRCRRGHGRRLDEQCLFTFAARGHHDTAGDVVGQRGADVGAQQVQGGPPRFSPSRTSPLTVSPAPTARSMTSSSAAAST